MAFNRRVITKELDMANLAKHNDNYTDIKTELDAHDSSISSHVAAQTAHGSTSAATAGKIVQRDSNGRAKVAAPAAADDIARKAEVDAVQTNLDTHEANAAVHLSAEDRAKFDGIEPGAEPNQNAFAQVNDVVAAAETDTLTIEGGTGITISTNTTTKKVIVTATGEATPGPHGPSHNIDGADPIPDLVTLRGDFDSLTPADIGAETPAGAQAKVDALAGAGNTKTVADVAAQLSDMMNPPRAQYKSNIDITLPTATWRSPKWNIKIADSNNFITQDFNETIIISSSGLYLFQVTIGISSYAGGIRNVKLIKNDSEDVAYNSGAPGSAYDSRNNVAALLFLNAGETIRAMAFQDTGGDLTLRSSLCNLSVVRISPP